MRAKGIFITFGEEIMKRKTGPPHARAYLFCCNSRCAVLSRAKCIVLRFNARKSIVRRFLRRATRSQHNTSTPHANAIIERGESLSFPAYIIQYVQRSFFQWPVIGPRSLALPACWIFIDRLGACLTHTHTRVTYVLS